MGREYKQEERSERLTADKIIGQFRRIISIGSTYEINPDRVNAESTYNGLGLDSLDVFALLGDVEDEFGIQIDEGAAKGLVAPGVTLGDLALYVENELNEKKKHLNKL